MQETDSGSSYLVSPEHPMKVASEGIEGLIKGLFGGKIPEVHTVPGDKDPWKAYSVGGNAGNPKFMNVGNPNIRLNNNDNAWHDATILFTNQVQALGHRFFAAPFHKNKVTYDNSSLISDRESFFDPYMVFVKYLCRLWETNTHVVAVELFNEPPITGLPNVGNALASRDTLFKFYGAVLEELDEASPKIKAPIAIEDLMGGVKGGSGMMNLLGGGKLDAQAEARLTSWANRRQLIWSFHYYPGVVTGVSLAKEVKLAKNESAEFGKVPLFLTEFWDSSAQGMADTLTEAADLGVNAATYWQGVSPETGTAGWFMYDAEITKIGQPIDGEGNINWDAWKVYEKTVADGTYYGADITGAEGGQVEVLRFVKNK